MITLLLLSCTGGSPEDAIPGERYSHVGTLSADQTALYITGGSSEDGRRVDAWRFDLASEDWTQLEEPPESIFRSTLVADGDEAYVFAGTVADGTDSDRLYRWDLASDTWTQLSSGPGGRYKAAALWFDDQMLLQGGRNDDSGTDQTLDQLWSYQPATDTWTELEDSGGPGELTRQALAFDPDRQTIWMHGGIDGSDTRHDWLWRLDPTTWQWTQLTWEGEGPPPSASQTLVYYDDQLFTWGGNRSEDGRLWAYDIDTGVWTAGQEGPAHRDAQVHGLTQEGVLYIMGGDPYDDENYSHFVNDVWKADLELGTWELVHPGG